MKIKKIISSLLIFSVFLCSTGAWAIDTDRLYYEYKLCTGNIYLLNYDGNGVIFRNVRTRNNWGAEENVLELEYNQVEIAAENIISADGKKLDFSYINSYLLDSKVSFLAAKSKKGIKIIYLRFL